MKDEIPACDTEVLADLFSEILGRFEAQLVPDLFEEAEGYVGAVYILGEIQDVGFDLGPGPVECRPGADVRD